MVTVGLVRTTALVICVLGIAGMIVTSILNHNGAAVTFGLITAVAVLCSMVAKAVATSTEQRFVGQRTGFADIQSAGSASQSRPEAGRVNPPDPGSDPLAAEVERQVQAVVAAGADEPAVRQLVGDAVRLGRALASGKRGRG